MADSLREALDTHVRSTGQPLASAAWLDTHYETCRPEFEALVRSVGLQPGWRVLDAGCGGGNYLPLLADLVGPAGRLEALDHAPENIATVEARLAAWGLPCPLDVRLGSLTAPLPYRDDSFDALWCAHVLEYLTDEALAATLAEFRRVVRPGGIVAVMDDEVGLWVVSPGDPACYWRLFERLTSPDDALGVAMRGAFRGRALRRWLERAGLVDVWQRTTLIERWAPLGPVERAYMGGYLAFLAGRAEAAGVPDADLAFWRAQRDLAAPGHLVNHPEFYWCEANPVAVGRVPSDRERQRR